MKRPPIQLPTLLLAVGFLALVIPVDRRWPTATPRRARRPTTCSAWSATASPAAETGRPAAALDPPPRNFTSGEFKFDADKDGVTGTDEDLLIVIKKGGAAFGGNPVMVPWMHAVRCGGRQPDRLHPLARDHPNAASNVAPRLRALGLCYPAAS